MVEVKWLKAYGKRKPGFIEHIDDAAAAALIGREMVVELRRLSDEKPPSLAAMSMDKLSAFISSKGSVVPKKAKKSDLLKLAREVNNGARH